MIQEVETAVLATLREVLTSDNPLARLLALLEPTKKLARMLAGSGLASLETRLSSIGKPHGGFSSHCSRETAAAQAHAQGGSRDATPSLPS
jgi:hypothetical protein